MIARLLLFLILAALAVVAVERLRRLLAGGRTGVHGQGTRPAAEIEQATRCADCGAWIVAGTRCRCRP